MKALQSDKVKYEGQIIVLILGFLFVYPTAKYIRNRRVQEILLNKQQDKLKDDLELDQFITNFQLMITEQDSNSETRLMLLGFMHTHREEC